MWIVYIYINNHIRYVYQITTFNMDIIIHISDSCESELDAKGQSLSAHISCGVVYAKGILLPRRICTHVAAASWRDQILLREAISSVVWMRLFTISSMYIYVPSMSYLSMIFIYIYGAIFPFQWITGCQWSSTHTADVWRQWNETPGIIPCALCIKVVVSCHLS
jgi:hypothetical protein